jgi:hypothetical protein
MRWHKFLGAPLLLIFSLANLGWHLLEQNHRQSVLAKGKVAQAMTRTPSGGQWVTVEWQVAAGNTRVGTAWTGKPFARRLKESAEAVRAVDIKYIDNSDEAVILSEVAERERVNNWWIRADISMAIVMGVLLAWSTLTSLWFGRPARPGN